MIASLRSLWYFGGSLMSSLVHWFFMIFHDSFLSHWPFRFLQGSQCGVMVPHHQLVINSRCVNQETGTQPGSGDVLPFLLFGLFSPLIQSSHMGCPEDLLCLWTNCILKWFPPWICAAKPADWLQCVVLFWWCVRITRRVRMMMIRWLWWFEEDLRGIKRLCWCR